MENYINRSSRVNHASYVRKCDHNEWSQMLRNAQNNGVASMHFSKQ